MAGEVFLSEGGLVDVEGNPVDLDIPASSGSGGALQDTYSLPAGALAQTLLRGQFPNDSLSMIASGRLSLAPLYLPEGLTLTSASFFTSGQGPIGPTNQWFGLFDEDRVPLRFTADDTTTPWAANAAKTLNFTSPIETTYEGLHYLGIMVACSGTVPTMRGMSTSTNIINIAPILNGASSTGLTDPASCPNPAGAITVSSGLPYGWVS